MLAFVGLKVEQPITKKQKYKEALQQIKHYLSSKNNIQLRETDYIIQVINGQYSFSLAKNCLYLHTNYYNMPILHHQDFQFMEICYECLMIVRENFPSKVRLELVTDAESKQLQSFRERKQEQFNRRVNSNLKGLAEDNPELDQQDVENIIFLINNNFTKKSKAIALRLLVNKVNRQNIADLAQQSLIEIQKLLQEAQFKKIAFELAEKIRSIQSNNFKNNENAMKMSNIDTNKWSEQLSIHPLIFQLKESYNLERICHLLFNALNSENDKQYFGKLQSAIGVITNKFINNEFEQVSKYGNELVEMLKRYWKKRGKKWDENICLAVQNKVKQSNLCIKSSKSRLMTSRKLLS